MEFGFDLQHISRTALLWVNAHQVAVTSYRRFGTTYRFHHHGSRIQIFSPETSEKNYQYLQSNNPEERSSHLLRGGSLKSRIVTLFRVLKATSGPRSPVVWEQWLGQMLHIRKVPISIPGVSICFPTLFYFSDNSKLLLVQTDHERHTSVYILTPISVHCSQLRD